MTDCTTPKYRRGDAFRLEITLNDDDDNLLDLDPDDLVAQVYDKPDGTKLADLTVTAGATVGTYILEGTGFDASEWPPEAVLNVFDKSDSTSSDEAWVKIVGQISRDDAEPAEPGIL